MTMKEWKEKTADIMKGELTLTRLDFFLITAIMLLAGICLGLLTAPYTHGVSIGSNNGNTYGNRQEDHVDEAGQES